MQRRVPHSLLLNIRTQLWNAQVSGRAGVSRQSSWTETEEPAGASELVKEVQAVVSALVWRYQNQASLILCLDSISPSFIMYPQYECLHSITFPQAIHFLILLSGTVL